MSVSNVNLISEQRLNLYPPRSLPFSFLNSCFTTKLNRLPLIEQFIFRLNEDNKLQFLHHRVQYQHFFRYWLYIYVCRRSRTRSLIFLIQFECLNVSREQFPEFFKENCIMGPNVFIRWNQLSNEASMILVMQGIIHKIGNHNLTEVES